MESRVKSTLFGYILNNLKHKPMKEVVKNYLHDAVLNAPLITMSEKKAFKRAIYSSDKILERIDMIIFKFFIVY